MLKLVVLFALVALAFGAPKGDVDGKIVGGTTVDISQYGWTLALQSFNRLFCGAGLISNNIALTAAHCVVPGSYLLAGLSVRAGSTQHASGGQQISISRIVTHESYSSRAHDYDIAVLFLSQVVTSPNAHVIPLAPASLNPAAGTYATITGWGAIYEDGPVSANLQMVQVPLISLANCQRVYGGAVTANMWCAGYTAGGKDSCQGDSGGPAIISNTLAGIVSFGAGCARPGAPGVYASVPAFRTWIRNNAGL